MKEAPLQDRYAPLSICFGCGAANDRGLRIKSQRHTQGPPSARGLRTVFRPEAHHQAFAGVVNGGIIGTLVDCHGNWTAAMALLDATGAEALPSTVTARYEVTLRRPTPYGVDLVLTSRIAKLDVVAGTASVEIDLVADGAVTARGRGLFVAVEEGHPAFHRWD